MVPAELATRSRMAERHTALGAAQDAVNCRRVFRGVRRAKSRGGRAAGQPTHGSLEPCDLVVAWSGKFDQVEAVAKRVGHIRDAAVFTALYDRSSDAPRPISRSTIASRPSMMKSRWTGVQCRPKSRRACVVPSSATSDRSPSKKRANWCRRVQPNVCSVGASTEGRGHRNKR